ncbi:hypothetical protein G9A89_013940 [Geosiphon pyriformis]|nr:hypothetical protein G9A89_013940 [Geosiphon pyriformis]
MELEKKTQDPGKVVTKYAKAIKKFIKWVDSERNWTEEQKIHFFTKGLRTDLSYALWPLLALKNNSTMDMAIELAQKIEDNQRMHLEFPFLVFVSASIMAFASQIAAISFAVQTQDPNKQLIDRLTANLNLWSKQLKRINKPKDPDLNSTSISPNNHHIKDSKIMTHLCAISMD